MGKAAGNTIMIMTMPAAAVTIMRMSTTMPAAVVIITSMTMGMPAVADIITRMDRNVIAVIARNMTITRSVKSRKSRCFCWAPLCWFLV